MRLIHCTQKLLKELGVVPTATDLTHVNPEGLGNWYANLLRFDRRKCILFTNERTLYSFLVPGVLKKDLLKIENLFRSHLAFNLQYEGFSAGAIERVMEEYKEIGFARTVSKSVLGSMNDLKHGYEFKVFRAGGIEHFNVLAVNQKMNKTPLKTIKYNFPIEEITRVIAF
jgi:hypothetical protein